jgi:hypothetical protein
MEGKGWKEVEGRDAIYKNVHVDRNIYIYIYTHIGRYIGK